MRHSPPLILVADDDPMFVELLREILTDAGYAALTCLSGSEAYALACREHPDAIILDVQMEQRYTGMLTLQRLRETPATTATPVILCSADTAALDTLQHYLQTYHCEVLMKPLQVEALLRLVRQVLGEPPRAAHG